MHDFDLLPDDDIAEDGEEGEDSWEGCRPVDDEEWNVIDLDAVCEISHAGSTLVGVGYDNDLVAAVHELCGQLVDVALDSSRLRVEEIADHSDVIRAPHLDRFSSPESM